MAKINAFDLNKFVTSSRGSRMLAWGRDEKWWYLGCMWFMLKVPQLPRGKARTRLLEAFERVPEVGEFLLAYANDHSTKKQDYRDMFDAEKHTAGEFTGMYRKKEKDYVAYIAGDAGYVAVNEKFLSVIKGYPRDYKWLVDGEVRPVIIRGSEGMGELVILPMRNMGNAWLLPREATVKNDKEKAK